MLQFPVVCAFRYIQLKRTNPKGFVLFSCRAKKIPGAGALLSGFDMFFQRGFGRFCNLGDDVKLGRGTVRQNLLQLRKRGLPRLGPVKQQVVRRDLKAAGQRGKDRQAQLGVPGFNVAHVGDRNADLLGKLLLRVPPRLPVFPYSLPDLVIIHEITYKVYLYLNCIGKSDIVK